MTVAAIVLLPALLLATGVPAAGQAPEQPEPRILTGTAAPSATGLDVTAECSRTEPGARVTRFTWAPARGPSTRQRVDITAFRDGFQKRERYEIVAQVSGEGSHAEWKGGEPGVSYYWRVLTLTPQGWAPSAVARYEVPICPVDFVEEPAAASRP